MKIRDLCSFWDTQKRNSQFHHYQTNSAKEKVIGESRKQYINAYNNSNGQICQKNGVGLRRKKSRLKTTSFQILEDLETASIPRIYFQYPALHFLNKNSQCNNIMLKSTVNGSVDKNHIKPKLNNNYTAEKNYVYGRAIISLSKTDENMSFGITISENHKNKGVRIASIKPGSLAHRNDSFEPGDRLVSINGHKVSQLKPNQIDNFISDRKTSGVQFEIEYVLPKPNNNLRCNFEGMNPKTNCHKQYKCRLRKDENQPGFGFVVRGGRQNFLNTPFMSSRPLSPNTISYNKNNSNNKPNCSDFQIVSSQHNGISKKFIKPKTQFDCDYNSDLVPFVVTSVRVGGPADREGSIKPGDRILFMDNLNLENTTLTEFLSLTKHYNKEATFTFEYDTIKYDETQYDNHQKILIEFERNKSENIGLILAKMALNAKHGKLVNDISLLNSTTQSDEKNNSAIIEDGQKRYVGVKKIIPATCADRCGIISVGDIILNINDIDTCYMSLDEANTLLNTCENPKDSSRLRLVLLKNNTNFNTQSQNNPQQNSRQTKDVHDCNEKKSKNLQGNKKCRRTNRKRIDDESNSAYGGNRKMAKKFNHPSTHLLNDDFEELTSLVDDKDSLNNLITDDMNCSRSFDSETMDSSFEQAESKKTKKVKCHKKDGTKTFKYLTTNPKPYESRNSTLSSYLQQQQVYRWERHQINLDFITKTGLGIALQDKIGVKNEILYTCITNIEKNSVADRCGVLQIGDRILSINNCNVSDLAMERGQSRAQKIAEKISQSPGKPNNVGEFKHCLLGIEFRVATSIVPNCGKFAVQIVRKPEHNDIGIRFTSRFDRKFGEPLVISDIKKGSPAYRLGSLEPGDECVSINDVDITNFSVQQAYKLIMTTDISNVNREILLEGTKKSHSHSEQGIIKFEIVKKAERKDHTLMDQSEFGCFTDLIHQYNHHPHSHNFNIYNSQHMQTPLDSRNKQDYDSHVMYPPIHREKDKYLENRNNVLVGSHLNPCLHQCNRNQIVLPANSHHNSFTNMNCHIPYHYHTHSNSNIETGPPKNLYKNPNCTKFTHTNDQYIMLNDKHNYHTKNYNDVKIEQHANPKIPSYAMMRNINANFYTSMLQNHMHQRPIFTSNNVELPLKHEIFWTNHCKPNYLNGSYGTHESTCADKRYGKVWETAENTRVYVDDTFLNGNVPKVISDQENPETHCNSPNNVLLPQQLNSQANLLNQSFDERKLQNILSGLMHDKTDSNINGFHSYRCSRNRDAIFGLHAKDITYTPIAKNEYLCSQQSHRPHPSNQENSNNTTNPSITTTLFNNLTLQEEFPLRLTMNANNISFGTDENGSPASNYHTNTSGNNEDTQNENRGTVDTSRINQTNHNTNVDNTNSPQQSVDSALESLDSSSSGCSPPEYAGNHLGDKHQHTDLKPITNKGTEEKHSVKLLTPNSIPYFIRPRLDDNYQPNYNRHITTAKLTNKHLLSASNHDCNDKITFNTLNGDPYISSGSTMSDRLPIQKLMLTPKFKMEWSEVFAGTNNETQNNLNEADLVSQIEKSLMNGISLSPVEKSDAQTCQTLSNHQSHLTREGTQNISLNLQEPYNRTADTTQKRLDTLITKCGSNTDPKMPKDYLISKSRIANSDIVDLTSNLTINPLNNTKMTKRLDIRTLSMQIV